MAMNYRVAKPGRYGTHPVFASKVITQTQNTTVNNFIGIPKVKCYVSKATVTLSTLGSDADGTIVGTLYAVATDGSTARALSDGLSLESDGVATALVPVNLTITGDNEDRTILQGETLRFAIVSSATTDTAPVGEVSVELMVLE